MYKDVTCLNEEKSKIASESRSLLQDIQSTEVFDAERNLLGTVGSLVRAMEKVRYQVCLMERKMEESKLPTPSLGGNLPVTLPGPAEQVVLPPPVPMPDAAAEVIPPPANSPLTPNPNPSASAPLTKNKRWQAR